LFVYEKTKHLFTQKNMKHLIIAIGLIYLITITSYAEQPIIESGIPHIGEDASSFRAETTKGLLNFPADYGKSWKVLFSHPGDFTPVCTSEILELALMQNEFLALDVKLAILSTDALELHKSWERSMNDLLDKNQPGLLIDFPLIDDHEQTISNKYGMISSKVDSRRTVRGVFIIGPDNKVEATFFYPNTIGRNLEELKRTVIALQTVKKHNVNTPVNWQKGDEVLVPYPYPPDAHEKIRENEGSYRNLTWYMLFKRLE